MRQTQLGKRHSAVTMLSILLLAGLFVCYVSGIIGSSGTALATLSSGFHPTLLAQPLFDEIHLKTHTPTYKAEIKTKGFSDVYFLDNTFDPGGHSGWHMHPGPSVVAVKSGTATYYSGDDPTCTPHVVQAGEGFVEASGHVHIVRNEGIGELETVVFQLIPAGESRRIDVPDPGNCHF